jgi:AcrR family transcriptional regulator
MYEKREAQQEKLVKAACALAAERGIGALRTRDIAACAGVSIGTLHYCFETKEHLLRALYNYLRAEFRAGFGKLVSEDGVSIETLLGSTRVRVHLLESQTPAFRAWRAFMREAWTDATVRTIVRDHLAEQRNRFELMLMRESDNAAGIGAAGISPRMAAALLVSIFEGMTMQWTIDPDAFTLEDYSSAIAELYGASSRA